ncbi:metallophosphoesterase [Psychrobium sp. 1_MG-2023]|uniref:metallophosphoesterase n=1 Tax=Psychrobium sp. 1_MG-2023 TaxID=3062624 RepID=UPI000C343725|nr:metallophosphoesterase [Psychrobium sp. 1_MG-2023]MDP2562217.1 metallophosphoesterase [Psychrobium sp. 1_MG-2023]PKF58082.1 phosphatase [Alteromonadales bacterium alter-6D02]
MKKALLSFFSLLLLLIISVSLFSRYSGLGIRVYDGKYIGYSPQTHEWLFVEYQNVPLVHDGPYVFNQGDKRFAWYVTGDGDGDTTATKIAVADKVDVTVENDAATTFEVELRSSYPRSSLSYDKPSKVLAMSDLEGNFDAMTGLLHANGVINDALDWRYGSGHLVLIGDMVDRGINVVPLLWLIYKLEAQAQLAGGQVHYVLGNHERYLLHGGIKSIARKYYGSSRAIGLSPKALWSESSELAQWLQSKPAMIKLGDTLYVHGGVSPYVLEQQPTLGRIDAEVEERFVLRDLAKGFAESGFLNGHEGLLFYRNLAKDMTHRGQGEKAQIEHVERVLLTFNASRIVIGHTLTEHVGHDFDRKVIRVDVPHGRGINEALLIENENLWRVDSKGNRFPLSKAKNFVFH